MTKVLAFRLKAGTFGVKTGTFRLKEDFMAHREDYVPRREAAFSQFFKFINQYVAEKCDGAQPAWTHIPQEARTALAGWFTAWDRAYAVTLQPCTKPQRDEKNRVHKTAEKQLRGFVNAYLRFHPAVTDYDREQMSLNVPSATRPKVSAPTAQPEADVVYPGVHLIELINIRTILLPGGEDLRADYGVRIFWGILGPPAEHDKFRLSAPPLTGDDLPHSVFTRRKRHRFNFSGDSGSTVYFCLRYENSKGEAGPFGPVFFAVIP
jgi:hypothetical protein